LNAVIGQVLIATAIGMPVVFNLTQQYLQKYSEHITLQWWHFAVSVIIMMVILLLSVS